MKKILSIIVIFITFLIAYILQSNFFSWFTISGVKPNLFILLALFIGIMTGKIYGGILGILIGLFLDFFISKRIGINTISIGIAGIFGGLFNKNVSNINRMTIALIVIGATFISEFVSYIYQVILFTNSLEIVSFLKIIIIEIIYNLLIVIIINPWIRKGMEKIINIFTKDKILTRTFS